MSLLSPGNSSVSGKSILMLCYHLERVSGDGECVDSTEPPVLCHLLSDVYVYSLLFYSNLMIRKHTKRLYPNTKFLGEKLPFNKY
jgi:hypothetical protein